MSEPKPVVSQPVALLGLNEQGQGVRVEFQKQSDRFGHTIFGVRNGEAVPLLTSVEGTPEEIAPLSPPFAELHQQDNMLFLTGATTLGHWSMSVQAVDEWLLFEVACRTKGKASHLGSTYRELATNYAVKSGNATASELVEDRLCVTPLLRAASDTPTTIQWRFTIHHTSAR